MKRLLIIASILKVDYRHSRHWQHSHGSDNVYFVEKVKGVSHGR